MIKKHGFLICCFVFQIVFFVILTNAAQAAVLSILPSSGTYQVGETLNVNINLDTEGQDSRGLDIHYLRYDPTLLEIQDANSSEDGVQISDGGLFANTQTNLVNTSQGLIDFSQLTAANEVYNGNGTLASISFVVLAEGTADFTFDFTLGQTDDCNVALNGEDILSSINNSSYTLGSGEVAPSPSPSPSPSCGGCSSNSNVPGNVLNLKATPGDRQIVISWTNPNHSYFEGVIIIRNPNGYPTSRNNGTEVYKGSDTSYTDTGLTNDEDYYYKVYSRNESNDCSDGVGVMATPTLQENPPEVLGDGTLVQGSNPSVYIIEEGQKRWIPSSYIFKTLGYNWQDIVSVSDTDLTNYPDGPNIIVQQLVRVKGDDKVYLIENGFKRHIPTAEVFNSYGFDWQDIVEIDASQLNQYKRAKHLKTATSEEVYYITESGLKRHILSEIVFESYGNKWEEIFIANQEEINAYPVNNLVRMIGDYRVYLLENGQKKWIKTAQAFNNLGYNWQNIAPVNTTEINAYPTGTAIE